MQRRFLIWYAAFVAIFGLLFPMAVVYCVDPLQFFRRAAYLPVFSTNERYQLPGLARNYDYDTVIVGTSMTQNFYLSYADRELGAHTLKLAISGSSAHEQFLVLSLAVRTGKVRRVLWGLDQWEFRGPPDRVRDDLGVFPYYFYESNPQGCFWYLFNGSTFWDSLKILSEPTRFLGRTTARVPDDWNTFDKFYQFKRTNAIRDFFNPINSKGLDDPLVLKAYDLAVMERSFRQNTLTLIKSHPEIEFNLFYPPYSILNTKFYQLHYPALFERLIDFQNFTMKVLVRIGNVRLFDFSDVMPITHNLDLYKDMGHFNVGVNEYIVRSIATGVHLVDQKDPEASTRRLRVQTENYPEPVGPAVIGQGSETK
jgi:hypothetical protein